MTANTIIPTIHMNGTGGKTLLAEYSAAAKAVQDAIKILGQATLNGRDFYPQGPHAFEDARDQRIEMDKSLESVLEALQAIRIGIMDQLA